MKVLNAALSILVDITQNKQTFHSALKGYFTNEGNADVNPAQVSAFVGCELRHFIVFNQVAFEFDMKSTQKCQLALGLVLANTLFLKRLEDNITFKFIENVYQEEGLTFNKEKFDRLIEAKRSGEPLISPNLDKMSFKFISQRYNVSEWIAKMWTHNFNKNTAFKIARANTKNPIQHLRVNTLLTSKDKLLASHPEELQACEFNDELLVYTGKEAVRKKKFVVNNRTFQINAALKDLIDHLEIDPLRPVFVFSGYYNLIPLELGIKYNNQVKVENLTTPNKDMYLFKNNLNRYQIKNVRTSEATEEQLITAISNPVQMFILMPENSNFERLRIDPDYFLNFDRMCLDDIIAKQIALVENASKFIDNGGYLVYTVPTIDKKEGQNIITCFLNSHDEFELVEEKQHFPFEVMNSTLYYAILRKKVENDK